GGGGAGGFGGGLLRPGVRLANGGGYLWRRGGRRRRRGSSLRDRAMGRETKRSGCGQRERCTREAPWAMLEERRPARLSRGNQNASRGVGPRPHWKEGSQHGETGPPIISASRVPAHIHARSCRSRPLTS